MKKTYRDDKGGGWKGKKEYGARKPSFGAKKPWDRGASKPWERGGERPPMHDATCNQCGNPCQVPFRPTGSKPIYCSACFKKEGGSDYAPKRFDGPRRSEGPRYSDDRPSFRAPSADNSQIEARLKSIEAKLDMLIEALTVEEDEET